MERNALAELDMDLEEVAGVAAETQTLYPVVDNTKDYFIERDGIRYAGNHVLVELWNAVNLDDPKLIEDALLQGARDAGATILHSHFHHFSPYSGVSGVVVLAESHISIHTWPEKDYAAIDIFMCGECDPHNALPAIKRAMQPGSVEIQHIKRGVIK
jgi:S-adenosylmethionine decarboxylase